MTRLITGDPTHETPAQFFDRVLGPRVEPTPVDWNARRKHICAEREAWWDAFVARTTDETFRQWLERRPYVPLFDLTAEEMSDPFKRYAA